MQITINGTTLSCARGDITAVGVDAIVNAANSSLMGGGGVDGAIHRAGGPAIVEECKRIVERAGPLPTGKAVATNAGNLPARYVIHTVGPVYHGGADGEEALLASCYRECLKVAEKLGAATIAFPSISTGAYRYPIEEAAAIAVQTVAEYATGDTVIKQVRFTLFSERDLEVYEAALERLTKK